MTEKNELLNHSIKAIEYRFEKAITGSKDNFGDFKVGGHTRTPIEIINHMFDLTRKTNTMIKEGHFNSPPPEVLDLTKECKRLLSELKELKSSISNNDIDIETSKKLLQGPIIDIATHIGQIAMLNGLNDNKVSKTNYYSADLK